MHIKDYLHSELKFVCNFLGVASENGGICEKRMRSPTIFRHTDHYLIFVSSNDLLSDTVIFSFEMLWFLRFAYISYVYETNLFCVSEGKRLFLLRLHFFYGKGLQYRGRSHIPLFSETTLRKLHTHFNSLR